MSGWLVKVTHPISYRVPSWQYCNHAAQDGINHTKDTCRFCSVGKGSEPSVCLIYNYPLDQQGKLIKKCHKCFKLTFMRRSKEVIDND